MVDLGIRLARDRRDCRLERLDEILVHVENHGIVIGETFCKIAGQRGFAGAGTAADADDIGFSFGRHENPPLCFHFLFIIIDIRRKRKWFLKILKIS